MVVMFLPNNQNVYRRTAHRNTLRLDVEIPEGFVFYGIDPARDVYFAHRAHDIVIAVHHRTTLPHLGGRIGRYAVLSFAGTGDDVVPVREEMDEWTDVLARVASLTAGASHGASIPRVELTG
ncbi:MAG TPA: hypothetical protein VJ924_05225 [Alphaproteobacteria bacterium]|nr:hypothetical protein [Alphaproteobacteria bacterium]